MPNTALLDTSFFIRLLNKEDGLHDVALSFYKYLLNNNIRLAISTIAIAEYCVMGKLANLPMKNLLVIPFNIIHAQRAGSLANIAFHAKHEQRLQLASRLVIPNDTKMFAQADTDSMAYFISADSEAKKVYDVINEQKHLAFQFIDIREQTVNTVFGELLA